MLPALARNAIETYSDPGALVLDPLCGTGTVVVEAIHSNRRAVGITNNPAWARLAHADIHHARHLGAQGHAAVIRGEARDATRLLAAHARSLLTSCPDPGGKVTALPFRRVDLVLTAPLRRNPQLARLAHTCAELLKPGGFLVLVSPPPGAVKLCAHAGLVYWQHVVALTLAIGDGRLQASSLSARRRRWDGPVSCHRDVLVFRHPETAAHATATEPVAGVKAVTL